MSNPNANLRAALRLQHVPRWGIIPTVKKQTVAEHSHGVAAIALWLVEFSENPIFDKGDVLEYAITHDKWEAVTGDIPAVAKHRGVVADNTPKSEVKLSTRMVVKLADYMEALNFLRTEEVFGNKMAEGPFNYVFQGACTFYDDEPFFLGAFRLGSFRELWKQFRPVASPLVHPGMQKDME